MQPTDEVALKTFLIALDQIEPPIAEKDYAKINQIGIAVAQNRFEQAISLILDLTQDYPQLRERYETAQRQLKPPYRSRDLSKAAVTTLQKTGAEFEQAAIVLLTGFEYPSSRLLTEDSTHSQQPDFWEKGDRVIAIVAGGAGIGGMIGQIPGALIGGTLAAIFGVYTSLPKKAVKK
ncbi:hypothetical protein ACQ4M3_39715 [Leptolyngbya sp. AN03gr2]|uniref:hypothetical protein n=1 Tax=unclassified Leptolyngbya TaxID=2650499 RepID=UPI003D31EF15